MKRQGGEMKKIFLVSAFALIAALLTAAGTGELLKTYPSGTFKFDFDGDGRADTCLITCKKVKDYSTDKSKKEKLVWYQFGIKITGAKGQILLSDVYSSVERDYASLFERSGLETIEPGKYVRNFFDIKGPYGRGTLNGYAQREIEKNEISRERVAGAIKEAKSSLSVDDIAAELAAGEQMVVLYRATWVEDVRQAVYSNKLKRPIWLLSDYDGKEKW
jgi:hypothetical protein